MNKALRRPLIAGNWKMNKTPTEAKELIADIVPAVKDADNCDIVICVPFIDLALAVDMTYQTNVKVGAQNVHFAPNGAYTGEISAAMLKELGVEYVIIGHSERRQYFGETDETVNLRVRAALDAGLKVILCVGENKDERLANITNEIVSKQTKLGLADVTTEALANVIIAYEPVWAIGTGLTATPEQAEEVCSFIRKVIAEKYGTDAADKVIILYGGSMNAVNARDLLAKEDIDGGLIGGASLKAKDFSVIVSEANA